MIDPKWLKEREEATNRLFAEIERSPGYPEVARQVRKEYEEMCAEVKARRLARARAAASARWNGHSPVEWTSVRIPSKLASDLRRVYPNLSLGKAIQRLFDQHGAVSP